jgi:hypothetical protein
MADFNNKKYDEFFHITRGAELIVVKDRDVMAFFTDTIPLDASSGMGIYRDATQTFVQYESDPFEDVKSSQRTLLWGRLAGTELVSGFRWVPYIIDNNVDTVEIKPLREVFDPRVVFDRTSNMLHLWFWTNVNLSYNGEYYDDTELYPVGCQGFQEIIKTSKHDAKAKKVLCYAVGSLYHAFVKGGFVSGFEGIQFSDESWDLVPVFTRPKLVNLTVAGGATGPGIVVDGWYLPTGTTAAIDVVVNTTFSGGQFHQIKKQLIVYSPIGSQSVSTVFSTTPCPTGPKPAVVQTSKGFRELACIEAPEVLLYDVMCLLHTGRKSTAHIDPLFMEVCEPGSIKVVSVVPDKPVSVGARVVDDVVKAETERDKVTTLTFMLCGTRKGFAGRRFEKKTEKEYQRNIKFWREAT